MTAQVDHGCAHHHAHKQGTETPHVAQANSSKHHHDGQGQLIAPGVEEAQHIHQHQADDNTQCQRAHNLHQRLYHQRHHGQHFATLNGACQGDHHCIEDQAQCIVHGHHRQQHLGHGAVCLVLADDHQRGGRSRSGSNGTQSKAQGQRLSNEEQHQEYQQGSGAALENGDDNGLDANFLQVRHFEFAADGIGDEAQCHIGDNGQLGVHFRRQCIQHIRANYQTCQQICRNVRQMNIPNQPTEKQPHGKSNGQR